MQRWWQGRKGRNRVLIVAFAALALATMLTAGISNKLLGGDKRQVVATMAQGVSDADRTTVKQACGGLPGVTVVADKGAQRRQAAFPVRFGIAGSTPAQESALYACLDRYRPLVRGVQTEGGAD
ncbi:MAG: hypothetical protein JWL64_275 [Frankiales bacterium]|nr:hypothetical protein [Frankiales bacterium]